MESEFIAGVIPHALACVASWDSSVVRYPAHNSDGTHSGGVPMGSRVQLDPSYDISGLPVAQQIIAKALQVYGMYVCDSTSPPMAFHAQVATTSNSAYSALMNNGLNEIPWSQMRVLSSWDGS
jgi:hypothetical protein